MIGIHKLSLSIAFSTILAYVSLAAETVILESDVISHIDGLFIKADLIECMQKTRKDLITIIEEYHLHDLAQKEVTDSTLTDEALFSIRSAKEALQNIVQHFSGSARSAKSLLLILIKEDCHKRNRPNSPLLDWATIDEDEEDTVFECTMINARTLYTFCVDLANFLHDLIQSCPKACALFNERRTKEHHIFKLLPNALAQKGLTNTIATTIAFLKFVKKEHIDQLRPEIITPELVEKLLAEYIEKTT